jgi:hypothetical protein
VLSKKLFATDAQVRSRQWRCWLRAGQLRRQAQGEASKNLLALLYVAAISTAALAKPFTDSAPPETGKMRMYVFRPAFNDQAFLRDQPVFRVDGKVIGRFSQGSFAEIKLGPGHHQFSIKSSPSESPM